MFRDRCKLLLDIDIVIGIISILDTILITSTIPVPNLRFKCHLDLIVGKEGRYLKPHSAHFIYSYMALDRWFKDHSDNKRKPAAATSWVALLHVPSYRQTNTYHHSLMLHQLWSTGWNKNGSLGPLRGIYEMIHHILNRYSPLKVGKNVFLKAVVCMLL